MNKANQQVVAQNANIALIAIRQSEISYFNSFFSSFGIQCFFLTGVLAGSVSQTPAFDCASDCNYFWQMTYNVGVAVSMGFTCLCLIGSVFIGVFGQGLAIRGQTGSMINAVQGMIAEQGRMVIIFLIAVIAYMVQAVGLFFVVMDWEWATVCSIIVLFSCYYTYYCSARIYNRFRWDFAKSGWNFDKTDDEQKELCELAPDVVDDVMKRAADQANVNRGIIEQLYRDSVEKGLIKVNDTNQQKTNIMLKLLTGSRNNSGKSKRGSTSMQSPSLKKNITPSASTEKASVHFDDISESSSTPYIQMMDVSKNSLTKGYLQVLIDPSAASNSVVKALPFSGPVWKNYYFILKGCYMFYYPDEKSYMKNASKPINARPIDLEGYKISSEKVDGPFEFSLSPIDKQDIRKTWRFRCNSLNTYKYWVENIRKIMNTIK